MNSNRSYIHSKYTRHYCAVAIALLTFIVYLPALQNRFVNWDDDLNILNNNHIRSLDMDFFVWAFSDISLSYWQPVNWFSHAVDYAIWGFRPMGHHLTNIVLHSIVALLVVQVVARLLETAGSRRIAGRSPTILDRRAVLLAASVTGAIFGLHPLNAESVAWVTGRPGMLCTLFLLLSISSYLRYVQSAEVSPLFSKRFLTRHYLLSLFLFAIALACKQTAIPLPLILLVMDWYPLNRVRSLREAATLIVEKIPYLLLSFVMMIIAVKGQRASGDLLFDLPLKARALVASKSLVLYLSKMVLPVKLVPFYPYPEKVTVLSWTYLAPLTVLIGITAAGIYLYRKYNMRLLLAVWVYYLILLLPVIGVVKVRAVAMADRYIYMPGLGPFLLAGLSVAWVWERAGSIEKAGPVIRRVAITVVVLISVVLSYLTVKQIQVWKDSVTLWGYVIEQEPGRVAAAYNNRGLALKELRRFEKAVGDFTSAIALAPASASAYNNRGLTFDEMGRFDLALSDFNRALSLDPASADAYIGRGWVFRQMGQPDRAMDDFNRAISIRPGRPIAYNNRGLLFQDKGRLDLAMDDFTAAISLNPFFAQAYTNRGLLFGRAGQTDAALRDYTDAIKADPSFANAYNNRGLLFERTGRYNEALGDLNAAIRLNPESTEAFNNRGLVYEGMGLLEKAIEDYGRAISLKPDDYLAYNNRAIVFQKMGDTEAAGRDFQKACDFGSAESCEALHALSAGPKVR